MVTNMPDSVLVSLTVAVFLIAGSQSAIAKDEIDAGSVGSHEKFVETVERS